jgi:hypothetical protein
LGLDLKETSVERSSVLSVLIVFFDVVVLRLTTCSFVVFIDIGDLRNLGEADRGSMEEVRELCQIQRLSMRLTLTRWTWKSTSLGQQKRRPNRQNSNHDTYVQAVVGKYPRCKNI